MGRCDRHQGTNVTHSSCRVPRRVLADGGADRLRDDIARTLSGETQQPLEVARGELLPDLIVGDMDSASKAACDYYRSKGVTSECSGIGGFLMGTIAARASRVCVLESGSLMGTTAARARQLKLSDRTKQPERHPHRAMPVLREVEDMSHDQDLH